MAKIIISSFVDEKMDELVDVLYEDEYYGFMDDAIAYVVAIYNFIRTIPDQKRKPTANTRFGKYYCRYKHDRGTVYYITFDIDESDYFIQNIISNHTSEYPVYIINPDIE